MASRWWDKLWSLSDSAILSGKFQPNGASALAGVLSPGIGCARTGVGVITLTLQDKFFDWESFLPVLHAPAANETVEVTSISTSTKTIVLTTKISGAAADLPNAANKFVSFTGKFLRSSRVP